MVLVFVYSNKNDSLGSLTVKVIQSVVSLTLSEKLTMAEKMRVIVSSVNSFTVMILK